MGFADELLAAGFHNRFRTTEVPFQLREEDSSDNQSDDTDGGNAADEGDKEEGTESESGGGLDLRGLAVPFDSPTRIQDFFGEFDEEFAPGSFKRTLGMNKQVMLFEHGEHPMFGSLPIADIRKLEETDAGLEVKARMFDNWMTEPLRDAIRNRAITGMSIQFRPIKEEITERDDDVPQVRVTEAELRELGPVLFPAYGDTSVELRSEFEESVRRGCEMALRSVGKQGQTGSGFTHLVKTRKSLAEARLVIMELE